jgi:hypothetical protein
MLEQTSFWKKRKQEYLKQAGAKLSIGRGANLGRHAKEL